VLLITYVTLRAKLAVRYQVFFPLKVQTMLEFLMRLISGKQATFRTEFLPPNGLGTVSPAWGSGIHWPSTTMQYS
jgi:hypothetical protein